MNDVTRMIRAAAEAKAAQEAEKQARREQRESAERERIRAKDQLLNEHAVPILREFQKELTATSLPAYLNLDGNFPSMSKFLHLGSRSGPGTRSSNLRVEPRDDGTLRISVFGGAAQEREWVASSENVRVLMMEALEDVLNRWHGIAGYR